MDETRAMARDTKAWRAEVAKHLGSRAHNVKKGVSALMFGMNSNTWRRRNGIADNARSPLLDRLEKEIKAARVLITDDEVKEGRAKYTDKPTRILSRAVERVEVELMTKLRLFLQEQGWETTSLIHDEITIQRSAKFSNHNEELQSLTRNVKLSLRDFESTHGWPPGSLQMDI